MAVTSAYYHGLAEACTIEAEAALLDNVRERCLRSAAAWRAMAERSARTELLAARTATAKAATK